MHPEGGGQQVGLLTGSVLRLGPSKGGALRVLAHYLCSEQAWFCEQ